MCPLLHLLSPRKSGSLFSLFSPSTTIPSSMLPATPHLLYVCYSLPPAVETRTTGSAHMDASAGKKWHSLSYSHYPSWLRTIFLIIGSISLALLPATAHGTDAFRDLWGTTPDLQLHLPSLAQRHHLDYLLMGNELFYPVSSFYLLHFVSYFWRYLHLAQHRTIQKSFVPCRTMEINCTLPVTGSLPQEWTQERLGLRAPCILLYWTFFPLMYLTIFQFHANSRQPGETVAMTSRVTLCLVRKST